MTGQATQHRCPWCHGTGVDPAADTPEVPHARTSGDAAGTPKDAFTASHDRAVAIYPEVAAAVVAVLRPSVFTVHDRAALTAVVTEGLLDPRSLHPAVMGVFRAFQGAGDADQVMASLVEHHHADLTTGSVFGAATLIALVLTSQAVTADVVVVQARLAYVYWMGQHH